MKSKTIKTLIVLLVLLSTAPTVSYASDAENIATCVKIIKAHTGRDVKEFSSNYTHSFWGLGWFWDSGVAEWQKIKCEVTSGSVGKLTINGNKYIIDGFSTRAGKKAHKKMEKETETAISQLNLQVESIQQKLERSKKRLESEIARIQQELEQSEKKVAIDIDLLQLRLKTAKEYLQHPSPDIEKIRQYISDGLLEATNQSRK